MAIIRPVVLNINKPLGWTSRDVLNKLQNVYNFKHFGHAGTLDPLATGVLIVLVANATKNQNYYLEKNKEYKTRIFFGVTSETYDLEGPYKLIKPLDLTKEVLENKTKEYLTSILGKFNQTVPYYSSTKVEGKELYAYARAGEDIKVLPNKEVELFEYTVNKIQYTNTPIHQLPNKLEIKNRDIAKEYSKTLEFFTQNFSYIDLTLKTGKGFYVRSLANDLGEYTGLGAVMGSLVRSKVGDLVVEDAKDITYFNEKPDLI